MTPLPAPAEAAPGAPTAVEILNATLDELRNEPRFVVENRKDRRARERRQRRQSK